MTHDSDQALKILHFSEWSSHTEYIYIQCSLLHMMIILHKYSAVKEMAATLELDRYTGFYPVLPVKVHYIKQLASAFSVTDSFISSLTGS